MAGFKCYSGATSTTTVRCCNRFNFKNKELLTNASNPQELRNRSRMNAPNQIGYDHLIADLSAIKNLRPIRVVLKNNIRLVGPDIVLGSPSNGFPILFNTTVNIF